MPDVHTEFIRSKNMKAIRSRDTYPELVVRRMLHRNGYRYSVAPERITGKPDIWMKKWNAAIFINGCFWHVHDCAKFRWPKSNAEFWKQKLLANKDRDKRTTQELLREGRRVLIIWECAIKGKNRLNEYTLILLISVWLQSKTRQAEINSEGLRML
ncbi:very short patch repair endonuclease [Vibrio vulnificus]|uniref:very short patch repair endonuclease n=1 Tax=Vibrio vulnificus TaxID=672 RepID=UPI0032EFD478